MAVVVAVACASVASASALTGFYSLGASNSGDSFKAGTVALSNNSSGSAPVSLSNAVPTQNDTSTGCVTVTYGGSLSANVRMYASSLSDGGLAPYLNVTVTHGSFSGAAPAYPSCTSFVADSGGQIYSGTLAAFPTSFATGVGNLTWSNGSSHVYEIQVQLQDTTSAKGKNASATFTWEAQNQ